MKSWLVSVDKGWAVMLDVQVLGSYLDTTSRTRAPAMVNRVHRMVAWICSRCDSNGDGLASPGAVVES